MSEYNELEKNIKKLMALLKQIMMSQDKSFDPKGPIPPEFQQLLNNNKNLQLNLCVFALLPLHPDEMDELEDALVGNLEGGYESSVEEASLPLEMTPADLAFLKKHGIKF